MTAPPRLAAADEPAPETVRLSGVGFGYADSPGVLRDVNLILPRGSFHFLTGPSGAGKSSLLRLLTLAERPTSGRISLFGRDVTDLPASAAPTLRRRRSIRRGSSLDIYPVPVR
jgi:cell division transport system ATP-binding protein